MNARLLKLAPRDARGIRRWSVPGWVHPITVNTRSMWGCVSVSWQAVHPGDGSTCVRMARFDWHWRTIKREIREALHAVAQPH